MLNCDVGLFYKRRDLSVVIDGKNPIVAHEYIGKDVDGRDVIIVDDMIASGESMLEVVRDLKKRGAQKIYMFATFAFFTKGIEAFDEAYENKEITKLYTTNLSYVTDKATDKNWFVKIDCSAFIAQIINALIHHQSLSPLLNGKKEMINKINAQN
jgi:ribose-phosphate pyrophosphokinase